jgi:monofunctional biosynthetic peptidoglycan transglycosylase
MASFWKILKKIFIWLFVLHLVYIVVCKWLNPPITVTQIGSLLQGYGLKRDYISFNEMGINPKIAVIASEDQLFPDHSGFDLKAIEKAQKYNERHPKKVRGASTISQQVAKNVFLWQGRSYFRKGLEVYFTFMIEIIWGKERILEVYLNVAEMGKGIFGIQAAAKHYYNKDANKLTRAEAAMIVACLPNPKKYNVKPPSKFVLNRQSRILRQMNNLQGDDGVQEVVR